MIDFFVGKRKKIDVLWSFLCGCTNMRLFHAMNLCSLSLNLLFQMC